MTVMITSDFFNEYEIYRTTNPDAAERIAKAYANFKEPDPEDINQMALIASQDETCDGPEINAAEAIKTVDRVIYVEDLMDPEE